MAHEQRLRISFVAVLLIAGAVPSVAAQDQALWKFGEETSYFYLRPTKQRYDELQQQADRFANALQKRGNRADLLIAVTIARVSEKYQWDITGKSKVSEMAREIKKGDSQLAKYVRDDRLVDLTKLDVWWSSFFATGDKKYLIKILRCAEPPQPGKHAAELLVPYAARWSFKTNCGQHKAVAAFAEECLDNNAFPSKKDFLKECVAAPKHSGHYR